MPDDMAGTAALAQTPVCNGHNVYPCSVGGTLLVLGKPTGLTFGSGSGIISSGSTNGFFTNDPQSPGITATTFGG